MKSLCVLSVSVLLMLISSTGRSQPGQKGDNPDFISGTEVLFEPSAVEALYSHPGEILCRADSFWTANSACRLAVQYSKNNRIQLDREEWKKRVSELALLGDQERAMQPAMVTSAAITDMSPLLNEKGFAHISSFLPASASPLKVTVYLISDIKPAAFAYPGGILVNVNSPRFNNDPSVIMNIIVHEVYHGGFASTIAYRSDYEVQNEAVDFVMDFLLNEGMATYVSYSARSIFPNDFVPDYKMMDNNDEVKLNLMKVDQLFRLSGTLPADSIRRLAWQTGVVERAFYIAGGYMAGVIDRNLGREELVRCMSAGPLSFLRIYNSVALDGMKIIEPEPPDVISPAQNLRLALAKNDTSEYRILADKLIQDGKYADEALEKAINKYGYIFMRTQGGAEKALELFKLNVKLFPESYRAFDSLGEGYMNAGDHELAIMHYSKSLALNPSNENARRVLDRLQQQK